MLCQRSTAGEFIAFKAVVVVTDLQAVDRDWVDLFRVVDTCRVRSGLSICTAWWQVVSGQASGEGNRGASHGRSSERAAVWWRVRTRCLSGVGRGDWQRPRCGAVVARKCGRSRGHWAWHAGP